MAKAKDRLLLLLLRKEGGNEGGHFAQPPHFKLLRCEWVAGRIGPKHSGTDHRIGN